MTGQPIADAQLTVSPRHCRERTVTETKSGLPRLQYLVSDYLVSNQILGIIGDFRGTPSLFQSESDVYSSSRRRSEVRELETLKYLPEDA